MLAVIGIISIMALGVFGYTRCLEEAKKEGLVNHDYVENNEEDEDDE